MLYESHISDDRNSDLVRNQYESLCMNLLSFDKSEDSFIQIFIYLVNCQYVQIIAIQYRCEEACHMWDSVSC